MINSRIAILGATSKTGLEIIKMSSQLNSIQVYAFVRNIDKLKRKLKVLPQNLTIVPFDIRGDQSWSEELGKCNVWISIVGIAGIMAARKPNQLYEKTGLLLRSMSHQFNPERIIVVTSGGVVESESEPWILKKILKPYFLNPMYEDMRKMEQIIRESTMNYTVVRPPYLTNGKMIKEYRIIMDEWFKDDKVLSRKDLAHFILKQSTELNESMNRRFVGVSY